MPRGDLHDPVSNQPMKKGMHIRTTSQKMQSLLDPLRCPGNHQHQPIEGSTKVHGQGIARSAFSEKYPRKFARLIAKVMLPPNCLTKHARSFRAFKTSHRRGSLTSKLPYANFAKLTAFWIVAQFPPVTKLAKRRKPYCCFRIQPKEQAHHRKSSMHKYRHALTMSIFHMMKIICRSTRTLIFSAHNDGAMRHVLVGYLSPLPHSGSDKSAVFSARPIQQAPPELSARNCPRV